MPHTASVLKMRVISGNTSAKKYSKNNKPQKRILTLVSAAFCRV